MKSLTIATTVIFAFLLSTPFFFLAVSMRTYTMPENIVREFQSMEADYASGAYDAALRHADTAEQTMQRLRLPVSDVFLYDYGMILRQLRNYDEALVRFRQAYLLNPEVAEYRAYVIEMRDIVEQRSRGNKSFLRGESAETNKWLFRKRYKDIFSFTMILGWTLLTFFALLFIKYRRVFLSGVIVAVIIFLSGAVANLMTGGEEDKSYVLLGPNASPTVTSSNLSEAVTDSRNVPGLLLRVLSENRSKLEVRRSDGFIMWVDKADVFPVYNL